MPSNHLLLFSLQITYDNGIVGGQVKEATDEIFQCDFTSPERITSITVYYGLNTSGLSAILGLEVVSDKRSCGLMGRTATKSTRISGHQLMFITGKFGSPNMKAITLYFDYGCQSL